MSEESKGQIALDIILGDWKDEVIVDDIRIQREAGGRLSWGPVQGYWPQYLTRLDRICHKAVLRKLGI